MNTTRHDFELLRAFMRQGDQSAFAALVNLHLDLVYGTAVRKLGDAAGAQEVAQDVFAALARCAWQFAPDDSLPAWLHRTTLLKSKLWLRGEIRRRRREQVAAQLGTTMKTPDDQPALRALVPVLDEALLSVSEKERTALLLRYMESRSLREVGVSLGISEDAAQKRVASALARVTRFFQRRGFKAASAVTAAAALQHSATSAPAALTNLVTQAVLQSTPPAATGLMALLARLAGLTRVQTAGLCLAIAAAPLTWQWTRTHTAQQSALALKSTIDSARAARLDAEAQTALLRARSAGLQAELDSVPPAEAQRRQAASLALSELRKRLMGLLSDSRYGWPDDLPFVRVPKWALKGIRADVPTHRARGTLPLWMQEVLDLSPEQKSSLEASLTQFLGYTDSLAASRVSETNWSAGDGSFHKTVQVSALGPEAQAAEDQMATNFLAALGPDGAKVAMSLLYSHNQWVSPEHVSHALINQPQQFRLDVHMRDSRPPDVTFSWDHYLSGPASSTAGLLPQFLADVFDPWLRQLGISNDVFSSNQP